MNEKEFIVLKNSVINIGRCLYIKKDEQDYFLEVTFSDEDYVDIYCDSLEDLEYNWSLLLSQLAIR